MSRLKFGASAWTSVDTAFVAILLVTLVVCWVAIFGIASEIGKARESLRETGLKSGIESIWYGEKK